MKILILNPPRKDKIIMNKEGRCMQRKGAWSYVMSPITMVILATILQKDGHHIKVIDCGVGMNDIGTLMLEIKEFLPQIIVVNTSTPTIDDDIFVSRLIKNKIDMNIILIMYGIHVSVMHAEVLRDQPGVDICVIGEPEITIQKLIRKIAKGENFKKIKGIALIDNGIATKKESAPFISNLDILPHPDWSFINTDHYMLPFINKKFLLINTSRGCPQECIFCPAHIYYGKKTRVHSVEYIVEELVINRTLYGVDHFMMWSENFLADKKHVINLCKSIIKKKLDINWVCNGRVDQADEELLTLMKQAGCWNIAYGIESGAQEILDSSHKKTSINQIIKAVAITKKTGMTVTGHVILGLPNETKNTIKKTLTLMNLLKPDFLQYYCAIPYPGTELYNMSIKNNWIKNKDWNKWEHNYSTIAYPHLNKDYLQIVRKILLLFFYFNPSTIINLMKKFITNPKFIHIYLVNIKDFFKWI